MTTAKPCGHKSSSKSLGLFSYTDICLGKRGYFHWWACLDSNQGPLPYQRSRIHFPTFPECAKYLQIRAFRRCDFSRVFRLFTPVAARLLHIKYRSFWETHQFPPVSFRKAFLCSWCKCPTCLKRHTGCSLFHFS